MVTMAAFVTIPGLSSSTETVGLVKLKILSTLYSKSLPALG